MVKMLMKWGMVLAAVAVFTPSAGATGTQAAEAPSPLGICPMGMRCHAPEPPPQPAPQGLCPFCR